MERVKIVRVSEEEQKRNLIILKEFYHAFTSGILSNAVDFLHDDGLFFGKWNKGRTLGYLHQLIHNSSNLTEAEFVFFNLGFSMDHKIGEPVIEMRFMPSFPWEEDNFVRYTFGEPANIALKETVYQFSATFKDLKIYSLRHPKKSIESIKYFIESN
jgi:hypothetical protein